MYGLYRNLFRDSWFKGVHAKVSIAINAELKETKSVRLILEGKMSVLGDPKFSGVRYTCFVVVFYTE